MFVILVLTDMAFKQLSAGWHLIRIQDLHLSWGKWGSACVCALILSQSFIPLQVRKEYSKCFRQSQCCGALPPEGSHSSAKTATSRSTARYSSATQVCVQRQESPVRGFRV